MSRERLEIVFRRGLELAPSVDVTALKYREIAEWDSIGHMALVAEIESDFDVMLTTEQVLDLSSFDKAVEILTSLGVQDL
jgi:acyl carrier protein